MSRNPDCIVIGGGVVGLTIAYRLAQEGCSVTLVERGLCGQEASWAGAGIISPCNPHRSDPLARFQDRSLELFPKWCEELLERTGVDSEYQPVGELSLFFDEQAVSLARSDVEAGRKQQMPDGSPAYRMLEPSEAVSLEPAIAGSKFIAATECRRTAVVRNPRLLQGLKIACEQAGVEIRESSEVMGFSRNSDRVTGVVLKDQTLSSGLVILSAGAWSSQIGSVREIEVAMPVHPVRGQMVLLKAPEPLASRVISYGKRYLVSRRDGHILLGSTEERGAGFSKRTTAREISKLLGDALTMAPTFALLPVVASWAGLRPGTPDNRPYLGQLEDMPGLITATGHFRSGLTLAPVTAEFIAHLVQQKPYDLDLTMCLPGRAMLA